MNGIMEAHVIAMRKPSQMIDIATQFITASMMDVVSLGKEAVRTLINDAMDAEALSSNRHTTIAATFASTCPDQTIAFTPCIGSEFGLEGFVSKRLKRHAACLLPIMGFAQTCLDWRAVASVEAAHEDLYE